ncbi:DUF5958 family protein [Sorangium sp. So ce260]|uniref:DUF5958 family protein n=1 Tax=Sorangium sp. So ce260 TaxID=3133291 RepID=UPI003F5DB304
MNARDHVAAVFTDPTRDAMITDTGTTLTPGGLYDRRQGTHDEACNMSEREVLLNQLAQGLVAAEEGRRWFSRLAEGEQRDVLGTRWFFAAQAGARESDVDVAIARAQLKPSFTPCVLLRNGRLKIQAAKVLGLPLAEREKSFKLRTSDAGRKSVRITARTGGTREADDLKT